MTTQPTRLTIGPHDVDHLFCENCNDNSAICGYETDDWIEANDDDYSNTCALCMELVDKPCYRCGVI